MRGRDELIVRQPAGEEIEGHIFDEEQHSEALPVIISALNRGRYNSYYKHEDILGNAIHTGTKDSHFTLAELGITENMQYLMA